MQDPLRKSTIQSLVKSSLLQPAELQERLSAIYQATTDLVIITDLTGQPLYINRSAHKVLGIDENADLTKLRLLDYYPEWAVRQTEVEAMPTALREGSWCGESAFLNCHKEEIPVSKVIIAHRKDDGELDFISIVARDLSEIKRAERSIQMFASIFENTQEGIMIADASRRIRSVNPAFTRLTGYQPAEVIGQNPRILQSGKHDKEFYKQFWHIIDTTGQWQGEIWNRRKNGEIYPEWLTISVVKNDKGEISSYVGVFSDITTIKLAEKHLSHIAHHDPLTGLPNRLLFADRLNLAIARADRNRDKVAVLFIDLDRFKPINDTLGHHIGDLLLQAVAERLKGCVREEDTVARLGGDEFTLVLSEIAHSQDSVKVAEKVLEALSTPFFLAGQHLHISCSIGISIYPDDDENFDRLIEKADAAMYQAKQHGGSTYQLFLSNDKAS